MHIWHACVGQAMKPAASFTTSLLDSLKKVYLTKVLLQDLNLKLNTV